MKTLIRVLAAAIGAVAIWFALANRTDVVVSFAPLPTEIELPLYLLVLLVFALGVLAGGVAHWLAAARHRGTARDTKRRLVVLERELDDLHDQRAPVASDQAQSKLVGR